MATANDTAPDAADGILQALARWAVQRPCEPACVDRRGSWSWEALHASVRSAAAGLQRARPARGASPVGVLMDNGAEFAIATCAVAAAGMPFELFPADLPADVRAELVRSSGVDTVVVDAAHAGEAWPGVQSLSLDQLWRGGGDARGWAPAPCGAGDALCSVVYSSGTTGMPKAILHSHAARQAVNRAARGLGIDGSCVNLVSLPMFNNLALVTWLPALVNGACNVLLHRFDARTFCEAVQAHQATHFVLSPMQYRQLLAFDGLPACRLDSVRLHLSSSSRLQPGEKAAIARRLPGQFCEIYGVTEGGVGSLLKVEDGARLHTVGKPMAMYEMKIIDGQGRELPAGQVGYIAGHSAFMMSGYRGGLHQPRFWESPGCPGRRFFVPGDLGYFDEQGHLVVLDRDSDSRWLDGRRWYPSEMESQLMEHSGCAELAVRLLATQGPGPWPLRVDWVGSPAEGHALRHALQCHFPQFQASLVQHDGLPRNGMGKLLRTQITSERPYA
jgi:acyl-CoA synthetase (AMP-forming)/AMP-acid ligase II